MRSATRGGGVPWWRTYFDETFYHLHLPLFPEEDSRKEVAAIRELLGLPHGARVLDVPCGWGRHTRLFAAAGHVAMGADLSLALLRTARSRRRARALYAASDVRALPFRTSSFDAVVNVFTSLGLFLTDREDTKVLREAFRVLVPGGKLLLETMHRDEVICAYAERDRWELPDGTRVSVRRRFDAVAGISYETLRWTRGSESGEKVHALRLRTATEVAGLLRRAGFRDIASYGGWEGEPFERHSERLIAVARRPPLR